MEVDFGAPQHRKMPCLYKAALRLFMNFTLCHVMILETSIREHFGNLIVCCYFFFNDVFLNLTRSGLCGVFVVAEGSKLHISRHIYAHSRILYRWSHITSSWTLDVLFCSGWRRSAIFEVLWLSILPKPLR